MILPPTLFAFIFRTARWHQAGLAGASVAVFLLTMAPLELQRRIVNGAIGRDSFETVAWLCAAYAGLALLAGAIKLGLNMYRGWMGEVCVRKLREAVFGAVNDGNEHDATWQGQALAVVVGEVDAVGGFAGVAISEPVLQGGILLSVFGYMLFLEPWIALLSLVLFLPQCVFVPIMQRMTTKRVRRRIRLLRGVSAEIIGDWRGDGDRAASFRDRVRRVYRLNLEIYGLKFSMNFLMNLMHHLGVVGVLAVGGWYVYEGHTEIGTIVAFLSGLARINDPWGDLVDYFRNWTLAAAKYELILSVFENPDPAEALRLLQRHQRQTAAKQPAPSDYVIDYI